MKTIRCAIYTRKSSEEGLDQSFNSLHAQREACEAYITSQSTMAGTPSQPNTTMAASPAEVSGEKAEVDEGAGEGAEGVFTRVFHCSWVLLLAISAHVFNGL
jgi:hypothetical protein